MINLKRLNEQLNSAEQKLQLMERGVQRALSAFNNLIPDLVQSSDCGLIGMQNVRPGGFEVCIWFNWHTPAGPCRVLVASMGRDQIPTEIEAFREVSGELATQIENDASPLITALASLRLSEKAMNAQSKKIVM